MVAGEGSVDVEVATSPGCVRVTMVQRTHGCFGTTATAPMRDHLAAPCSSTQPVCGTSMSTLGRNRRTFHSPAGCSAAAARRLALVSSRSGMASTKRPGGIVHSIAVLVSSVGSAKNSAWSPTSDAVMRRTRRASHWLSAASVAAPSPARQVPSGSTSVGSAPSPIAAMASSRRGSRRRVRTRPVSSSWTAHRRSLSIPSPSHGGRCDPLALHRLDRVPPDLDDRSGSSRPRDHVFPFALTPANATLRCLPSRGWIRSVRSAARPGSNGVDCFGIRVGSVH